MGRLFSLLSDQAAAGQNVVYSPHAITRTLTLLASSARGPTQKELLVVLGQEGTLDRLQGELQEAERRFKKSAHFKVVASGLRTPGLVGSEVPLFEYDTVLDLRPEHEASGPFDLFSEVKVRLAEAPPRWTEPLWNFGVRFEKGAFHSAGVAPLEVEYAHFMGAGAGPLWQCNDRYQRLWWVGEDFEDGRIEPIPGNEVENRAVVTLTWAESGEVWPVAPLAELCDPRAMERKLTKTVVDVHVPLFASVSSIDLSTWAAALAISSAFNPARADFGVPGRYVRRALHRAELGLDRYGTINQPGRPVGSSQGIELSFMRDVETVVARLDRPFIVTVHDPLTGVIFYVAFVARPNGASPKARP